MGRILRGGCRPQGVWGLGFEGFEVVRDVSARARIFSVEASLTGRDASATV